MTGYLVDTNVISEIVRPRPDPNVVTWMESVDESLLHLSVLTLGEIRKGISLRPRDKRRTQLEAWLEQDLRARFAGRILPIDEPVADHWGLLIAEARRKGKESPGNIDALLAATALHYNLTLVTRNVKDLANTPVQLLNPW
jgi:toxin FitB